MPRELGALGIVEGVDCVRTGQRVAVDAHRPSTPVVSRSRIRQSLIRAVAVPGATSIASPDTARR
jgi:hypothetical protein